MLVIVPKAPDAPEICCQSSPEGLLMKPENSPFGRTSLGIAVGAFWA
jgi:hypothetical protein